MVIKEILESILKEDPISGTQEYYSSAIYEKMGLYCEEVHVDAFYNITGVIRGNGVSPKKIMLCAHYDEIGFVVSKIEKGGFLRISPIGGIDTKVLLAKEVTVYGKQELYGVIGAKPPHLLAPEESSKAMKLENIYVDVGMDEEPLKERVSIGDRVVVRGDLTQLAGGKLASRAMDNRAGVACLIKVMEEIQKYKIPHDLYFVATTQEETHLTGAITSAYHIEPDMAIVVDACHGDMPDCPKDEIFALGKGPAIAVGPNLHKQYTKKLLELAKEMGIQTQVDIEPGDTGTEAWAIQVSKTGIPTLLLSIPLRYMHTPVEMLNSSDVDKTAKLIGAFITQRENTI